MQQDKPVYPISVAAELLQVHPRTLRLYEQHGLIYPKRRGNKRFFSNNDLEWIRCIREMIHEEGLNIEGIKRLLSLLPCWEVKGCSDSKRKDCSARYDKVDPCWQLAEKVCPEKFKICQKCTMYEEQRKEAAEKIKTS